MSMNREQRRAYLKAIRKRYKKSSKKQKVAILNEFCEVCDYNRKYAIRLLKKQRFLRRHKPGRKRQYESEKLLPTLKAIWIATDYMCSKRLKAALCEWVKHYEEEQGLLDDAIRGQLYALSAATIDRLLKPIRVHYPHKGLSGTKPGRLLKNQIPIKTDHWDVKQPGYLVPDRKPPVFQKNPPKFLSHISRISLL